MLFRARHLMLISLLTLLVTLPFATAGEPAWGDDISTALKDAKSANKPVLVDVWAIWCVPCREMDETTYKDQKVLETMTGFIPVKVDADAQKIFIERYRVDAFPTILMLDSRGNEITRLLGYVDAATLRETLSTVASGYADYLALSNNRKDHEALAKLGRYFTSAGNPAEGASCLRKALKRGKGAGPAFREAVELDLARAQIATENLSGGIKLLRRLSNRAASLEVKGQALVALVQAERARGKDEAAAKALQALREEFPSLAKNL